MESTISVQNYELELYKGFEKYLGKINLPKIESEEMINIESSRLVIILDVSGSMGQTVQRICTKVIPNILEKFYPQKTKSNAILVTFGSSANIYGEKKELEEQIKKLTAGGCTYMEPAVKLVHNLILKDKTTKFRNYRILSLSDGELHDQSETMKAADKLKQLIIEKKINVNSQALRLYTSSSQPDTRGLSSMLQLATKGKQSIIDIDCRSDSSDLILNIILELFDNDGFMGEYDLKSSYEKKIFHEDPWGKSENAFDSILLYNGDNEFWLDFDIKMNEDEIKKLIEEKLYIQLPNKQKVSIKCSFKGNISINNYQELIKEKIDYYLRQIKILKVVNTTQSINRIDEIINFFSKFEETLNKTCILDAGQSAQGHKIIERTQALKTMILKRKCSLANKMRETKNDEKINQLNALQQADYLRSLDQSTGKNLARRALNESTDFDNNIKKEIEAMANHIKELDSVDDSKLTNSFYSTCNTLEGIKAVCEFVEDAKKDNIFDDITTNDILKIINIVGVGAKAVIGNYTDPMNYKLTEIFPSSFVSLSDIITVYEIKKEDSLTDVGTKEIINTAIPYFEDETIEKFLIKYAPKLLEYSASIGMRRILAEIPFTNEYTLIAGAWRLVPMILEDKQEITIRLFNNLIKSYLIAAGTHFDYVSKLIDDQKEVDKDGFSIYLDNNGLYNLTIPIIKYFMNHKDEKDDEMIKRITRAIYQCEIYKYMRSIFKFQKEGLEKFLKDETYNILGINLEANKTKIPELFEKAPSEPIYYDKLDINFKLIDDSYLSKLEWIDNISIYPSFLKATLANDPIEEMKKIEVNKITEEFEREKLGINYDTKLFKRYCVVQSFLQHEQSDRCDTKQKKMTIIDCGFKDKIEGNFKEYIRKIYAEQYKKEMQERAKKEKEIIGKELAQKIAEAKDYKEFKKYLDEGITKGEITHKIEQPNSQGFNDLLDILADKEKDIPLRSEKIYVLATGKNGKEVAIWNKGNCIENRKLLIRFKEVIPKEHFDKLMRDSRKPGIHVYRDKENQRGHSNEHPSYWALGYATLEDMIAAVPAEEFEEYKKYHRNCCGFYKGVYGRERRKLKEDIRRGYSKEEDN